MVDDYLKRRAEYERTETPYRQRGEMRKLGRGFEPKPPHGREIGMVTRKMAREMKLAELGIEEVVLTPEEIDYLATLRKQASDLRNNASRLISQVLKFNKSIKPTSGSNGLSTDALLSALGKLKTEANIYDMVRNDYLLEKIRSQGSFNYEDAVRKMLHKAGNWPAGYCTKKTPTGGKPYLTFEKGREDFSSHGGLKEIVADYISEMGGVPNTKGRMTYTFTTYVGEAVMNVVMVFKRGELKSLQVHGISSTQGTGEQYELPVKRRTGKTMLSRGGDGEVKTTPRNGGTRWKKPSVDVPLSPPFALVQGLYCSVAYAARDPRVPALHRR